MPLHPEYAALLQQLAEVPGPALSELPTADARAMYRMMRPAVPELAVGAVTDRSIAGPAGDIGLRIYSPGGRGPFPLLVYFHGGGWVIGDLETADAVARQLCSGANCVVVSVDYRLAPEHRYPAAVEDCYAATQWVAAHADELRGDAARLAVAGESAGANLAAVVSLLACQQGGPAIALQLLAYPVTDASFDTASYEANAEGYLLTRDTMQWFWEQYCPDPARRAEPNASPLRARNLSGAPRALIMTAEFDPLRDEGEAYAARLDAAGVAVETVRFEGLIHDFLAMSHQLPAAKPGMDKAIAALRDVFGRG